MSLQLESRHFFQPHDLVEDRQGAPGVVVDASSLYARVRWTDGREVELEQFDPSVVVVERGGGR